MNKNVVGVMPGTELKNSITMCSLRTFVWTAQCQGNNSTERHRYAASQEDRRVAASQVKGGDVAVGCDGLQNSRD